MKINGVVYSLIGLVATSVLFIILYLCTHILEKCEVQNYIFLHISVVEVFGNNCSGIIPELFVVRMYYSDCFVNHQV